MIKLQLADTPLKKILMHAVRKRIVIGVESDVHQNDLETKQKLFKNTLINTVSVPQFSVCIPAYNDIECFTRCIASVLRQKDVSLECVVCDDSNSDSIFNYINKINDSRVRYYRNKPPNGAPKNWNSALHLSQGDVVTLLHQDDWYRSDSTLKDVLGCMQRNDADVCFCGQAIANESGEVLGEYPVSVDRVLRMYTGFPRRTLVVNLLGAPSVVFFQRRHLDVEYDVKLLYFSDTDYYYRLLSSSSAVTVLAEPNVGISRSVAQISKFCLSHLDSVLEELFYALKKHQASSIDSCAAVARFVASNLRHWRVASLLSALKLIWKHFSLQATLLTFFIFPIFAGHMCYRLFLRKVCGRIWA